MIGEMQISKTTMAAIALEVWRLHKKYIVETSLEQKTPLTFGLQRIMRELKSAGIAFVEFEDVPYDGGLAVHVLDMVQDENNCQGQLIIKETIEPMVLWRDQVIHEGEVVLARSVLKGKESKVDG